MSALTSVSSFDPENALCSISNLRILKVIDKLLVIKRNDLFISGDVC